MTMLSNIPMGKNIYNVSTIHPPTTEGIKYAGSKLKLLPQIISLCDGLDVSTIFDGFSGSTRVSQAFAQLGYTVTSSDRSAWSYVTGNCYLKNKTPRIEYQELIDHLNSITGHEGWFTENYGGDDFNGFAVQIDGSKNRGKLKTLKN